MDATSPHFGYVLASYVISAAVLVGLLVWTFVRKHRLEAEVKRIAVTEE